MTTIGETLRQAANAFAKAGIDTPQRDARALMMHLLDIDAARLIARERDPLPEGTIAAYKALVGRRAAREPVSKIISRKAFFGAEFCVTKDVLDPRPDSETLVETAIEALTEADISAPRILDLGTGSGCLLISLLRRFESGTGLGIDMSEAALNVAKANAKRLKVQNRCEFLQSNWLEKVDETFDLVVCNPPYIGMNEKDSLGPEVVEWDPPEALFARQGGLAVYQTVAPELGSIMNNGANAVFELGLGQSDTVRRIFKDAGWQHVSVRNDIAGIERCLVLRKGTTL